MTFNHIILGEVRALCLYHHSRKASCYTVADGIRYEIYLDDLTDY